MRYFLLKRGFLIVIFCLLMIVVYPIVSGELMIYPKEEGPYSVFIGGKCYGGTLPVITWNPFKYPGYGIHICPFCKYNYP